ncbi:hypothetical protein NITGR_1050010 [Nitrospina gracilis 3/211]|uniref:Uncharacterized protein n=1 Tax=Nitrospina gracilis (strain 3/211) TaxID=1266370 RepID=M1YG62_NITG3|nr:MULTISPECIES: hypothetical protein [Nitrospina]MCF8722248.1 TusA-related sulfurtransferase [Nitrospina sp. Nb-3]CCQ89447.1 hypothetical protein NITGR_1050010 [Nitrospina gracilis 3/211]
MTVFKTLDTRGLSFFSATDQLNQAFKDVKMNGILEIILDKKKNFSEAFSRWVESKGYKVSNRDEDARLVRLFISKSKR